MKRSIPAIAVILLLSVTASALDVEVHTGHPVIEGRKYLLAGWNFNGGGANDHQALLAVSHGIGIISHSFLPANVVVFEGTAINSFGWDSAGSSLTLQAGSGLVNNGATLTFQISMTGFRDLVLTYAARGTATGFSSHSWQYGIDGIEFEELKLETGANSSAFTLRTVDFSPASQLNDAEQIFIRVMVDGASGATGNNRIDNIQFRATAIATTAGPGRATLFNATAGSPYLGHSIFATGMPQNVGMTICSDDDTPITELSICIPDEWSGISGQPVLSGCGFDGAVATISGKTIEIRGAAIIDGAPGTLAFGESVVCEVDAVGTSLGRFVFTVRTAGEGDLPELVAGQPEGRFVIPISAIRPVNAHGVSFALGQKVAVSGVATVSSGVFEPYFGGRFLTWIQDDDGGVALVHPSSDEFRAHAIAGNRYTGVGTVSQERGATSINLPSSDGFFDHGPDLTPEPEFRTIQELLSDPEIYEGRLVRIAGVSKSDGDWPRTGEPGDIMISASGDGEQLRLNINRYTDIPWNTEPSWPADVAGIFCQRSSRSTPPFVDGYRIIPRAYSDFLPPSEELTGFDKWSSRFFPGAGSWESSVGADPDGDGLENLLEYAFGGDPHQNSRHLLPVVTISDGYLQIVFRRVREATDLVYRVEASTDMVAWSEIWSSHLSPYNSAETVIEETVRDVVRVSGTSSRFLRLVVAEERED